MADKNIKIVAIVMLVAGLMIGAGLGAVASFFWTVDQMSVWFYNNSEELCGNITTAKFYNDLADSTHSNTTLVLASATNTCSKS